MGGNGEMHTDVTGREGPVLARPDRPVHLLDRFADEMDYLLDGFGLGHRRPDPGLRAGSAAVGEWLPDVEMLEHSDQLIVRVDLPGLSREDVNVDVTRNTVTIQGERKRTHGHTGIHRSERNYGSFCRVISLPEGALTDQAKATFKDGVLEVTMPAAPQAVRHGRQLEIHEAEGGIPRSPTWEEWGPANEHI